MLVLALVIAALLLPAPAEAKVTCEEPVRPAAEVPLRGLPDAPIAGREYRLTTVLRAEVGVNPAPHLAAEYCGGGARHESPAGAGGWFRPRAGFGGDFYVLDLRFERAGPWALSFMDRSGVFKNLGLRHVRPAGEAELPRQQPLAGLAFLALEQVLWIFEQT
jgi:hypothetical protein